MRNDISIIKGIHPGVILERELKKRNLTKGRFSLSIGEYPQTIGAITNGKRDMNTALSIKIEKVLDIEEGYFMILQVYHDIKKAKAQKQKIDHPDFSIFRPALFWDTDINKINWDTQQKAVIRRVLERGNEQEKAELIRFYGGQAVKQVEKMISNSIDHS